MQDCSDNQRTTVTASGHCHAGRIRCTLLLAGTEYETREHGVGFAVKNSLMRMIQPGEKGTEMILSLQLLTTDGPVNLVSVYAHTLYSSQEAKDDFYGQLQTNMQGTPSHEQLLLLGDFNARVGAYAPSTICASPIPSFRPSPNPSIKYQGDTLDPNIGTS